jgi:hypothetical protein
MDETENEVNNISTFLRGRVIIPDAKLTLLPHPNLVPNKAPIAKSRWSGHEQVIARQHSPIPQFVDYYCDGIRLLIDDASSKIANFGSYVLIFFITAIGSLIFAIMNYSRNQPGDIDTANISIVIMIISILISLYLIRRIRRLNQEDFYIFDRSTGNVRLPKRFGCPEYTLPFTELELYTVNIPSEHSFQFHIFFYPKLKPKGARSVRFYEVVIGNGVVNNHTTIPYWAFLTRFMDSNQPVPEIPIITRSINLFKKYNKTLSDVPFEMDEEDLLDDSKI